MPKAKQFLKQAKGKKKKEHIPQTEDEFLEAGVDFEEAGEKWRAGDAAKSTRFFMRAIDAYERGLRLFPNSFDLAYNKARVQYSITQYPKLAAQIPKPLIELLQIALQSHRTALHLSQDNSDVLFNTAQVLTSLAECISTRPTNQPGMQNEPTSESSTMSLGNEAPAFLQEALELFQRCLTIQEMKYTQFEEMFEETQKQSDSEESPMTDIGKSGGGWSHSEESTMVTIEEPVTKETLVDTACAQLNTLTTLCETLTSDPGSGLAWIEEYSASMLKEKIPMYVEGTERQEEVSVARANFVCALADISYRSGRIDLQTYENEVEGAYGPDSELNVESNPEILCDKADALITLNSAVTEALLSYRSEIDPKVVSGINAHRWEHLTTALKALTMATKLQAVENLPKIHLQRGDVELLRFQLGQGRIPYKPSQVNASTLLKNAQVYYRGAIALARNEGALDEEQEATVKEALTSAIAGDEKEFEKLLGESRNQVMMIVREMVEDGLVDPKFANIP